MLDSFYRDTVAEIDLDAVAHNVRAFRAWLPPRTAIMATVKANGYGHGAEPVAREALDNGATFLGVATLDEAIELQDAGIRAPILVMGYIPVRGLAEAIARKIRITVYDPDHAAQVKEASAAVGKRAVVHLKADTGMGRLGVRLHEVPPLVEQLLDTRFFELEGLFTHFARADERDKQYTHWQANNLKMILQKCKRMGASFSLVHCGNSAAAIDLPQYGFNMVRIGISLYGLYPSAEVKRQNVALKPVMSLKTKIVHVKRVQAGTGISYGSTYRTKKEETIATLPIGYADGYNRLLSNRGQALVQGKRVPIVGRICMDQTMLAFPDGLKARVGDEVVLYGKQGGEELPVDEVAKWLGTINYEVTCMVNRRVPRVYMRNGRPVEVRVDTAKKL